MMTEDEAKTKWCFRGHRGSPPTMCVGSACMAFRWWDKWTGMTQEGGTNSDVVLRLSRKEGEPRLGYCGLAGKP